MKPGQNVLGELGGAPTLAGLQNGDIVWITDRTTASGAGKAYRVEEFFDDDRASTSFRFSDLATPPNLLDIKPESPPPDLDPRTHRIQVVTMTLTVFPDDPEALPGVWGDLPLDPGHERFGVADSFAEQFADRPPTLALARSLPIVFELGEKRRTGIDVLDAINRFSGGRVVAGLNDTQLERRRAFD